MATRNEISNAFEEIVPPSASSSKPTKKLPCDVFINHRGPDAKHTLATSIYNALHVMGVEVFLDEPELQLGDSIPAEIEKAMTTSFLHIAILSPKYAESPWCLAELSFMLKTGNRIIPVFYHVDISDIRWGKGIYTAAFSKHEASGRYTSKKLEDWRMALQNVTYLKGYIVQNNDDEGRLLKSIVKCVLEHSEKVPLVVAKHPIGLDKAIENFESSVLKSLDNVKIVGIVGMGGCGKTTLAKAYYNKKRSSFYKCSFLYNVRDAAAKKDLHNKQKMMLQDLGFPNLLFDNVEGGKGFLASHLRSLKVFIILDDVDHEDQLDALLPVKDSLGNGSLVIVTSRELGVLTSWGISIYKMKELNPNYARQLFCWHAFLQPSPVNGFENLVEEFLNVCKGLPLSLKVFGGQLYKKPKEYWDAQLSKVSRLLHKDIKDTLEVSFDALDEEEQEIFLDISCFFIGEEKHLAITVWDGSGWTGLHSLEALENKCLVELNEENRITMHDHLRDLGKEIAKRKSPYRIWSQQQINDIQIQGQESVLIRGIKAETDELYEECSSQQSTPFQECLELVRGSATRLKRPRLSSLGLEILAVKNNYFTEENSRLSAGLVWLRWVQFPHRSLPSWLSLNNLRVLELREADELEELWSDTAVLPIQLRELNISRCPSFMRFPSSIGFLQHLERISLNQPYSQASIEDLPEELCLLQSLEHLKLMGCRKLTSLPSKFGDLINLRHLDLFGCCRLMMLPPSFKQLIHLQYISLSGCSELTFMSDILENMTKLETLNFDGCLKLQELAQHITNQRSLKQLDVGNTSIGELPNDIGRLSNLQMLRIGSNLLKSLPTSIENLSSLASLTIYGCSELRYLPEYIGNLSSLKSLHISSCWKLGSLPEALARLTNLDSLYINNCPITELAFLSGSLSSSLCNLKNIFVRKTLVSRILISQQCCPTLEGLTLSDNHHLVEIDSLPISVKGIEFHSCTHLKSISGICGLVNLETLLITECGEESDEFPSFRELVSLKKIEIIRSAEQLKKIEGLENCRSLETFRVHSWWKVPVIQSVEHMESLGRLELSAECNISAFEPCLQTIEKWPSESIICGRAEHGVESVVKSFTFPGLTLVQSCVREKIDVRHIELLALKCGQRRSSNAAAMLCFVINSISDSTYLSLQEDFWALSQKMMVRKGKWVWIGVFTQSSFFTRKEKFVLEKSYSDLNQPVDEVTGMLMMGDEKRVVEAFYKLLGHLGNY